MNETLLLKLTSVAGGGIFGRRGEFVFCSFAAYSLLPKEQTLKLVA